MSQLNSSTCIERQNIRTRLNYLHPQDSPLIWIWIECWTSHSQLSGKFDGEAGLTILRQPADPILCNGFLGLTSSPKIVIVHSCSPCSWEMKQRFLWWIKTSLISCFYPAGHGRYCSPIRGWPSQVVLRSSETVSLEIRPRTRISGQTDTPTSRPRDRISRKETVFQSRARMNILTVVTFISVFCKSLSHSIIFFMTMK